MQKIFPDIKKQYIDSNKISYVLREFISNKQDLDATLLARCTNNTAHYLKFKAILLEQQDNWAFSKNYRELLTNIGKIGGVEAAQYVSCLNDKSIIQLLIDNTALVNKEPNFIGTPAFFINGKQHTKPYTLEELSKAINQALELHGQ
jgi:protein-disulfide isomerase